MGPMIKKGAMINWELYGFISKMNVEMYIVYFEGDDMYKDEMESLDMFLNDYLGWEIESVGFSTCPKNALVVVLKGE